MEQVITGFPTFTSKKLTTMLTQSLNEKASADGTFQGLYVKDQDSVPRTRNRTRLSITRTSLRSLRSPSGQGHGLTSLL